MAAPIRLYDEIPSGVECVVIAKEDLKKLINDYNELFTILNNRNTEKKEELKDYSKFKENKGRGGQKNTHLNEYKQIWRMIDEGRRPKDIIGNIIYKKNGARKRITQRQYYLAVNRRKEIEEDG